MEPIQFGSKTTIKIMVIDCFSRTSAAIRTAAMTCLQALFQIEGIQLELIDELLPDLLPKVSAQPTLYLRLH